VKVRAGGNIAIPFYRGEAITHGASRHAMPLQGMVGPSMKKERERTIHRQVRFREKRSALREHEGEPRGVLRCKSMLLIPPLVPWRRFRANQIDGCRPLVASPAEQLRKATEILPRYDQVESEPNVPGMQESRFLFE
jgi:hypothetical protein